MITQSDLSPDKLADTGRALYGERWQAMLAAHLRVADRTLRRWLSGEAALPNNVESELRELLLKRLDEIGGLVGYSVHPSNRTVFHYPSAACFQYDETGAMTLLTPLIAASDNIPLIKQGAIEALRWEQERHTRGAGAMWMDQKTGSLVPANQIEEEYKGCVITYPRTPMFSGRWTVNLASNNPHLLTKLGGNVVINSHVSLERAIADAKRRVDEL